MSSSIATDVDQIVAVATDYVTSFYSGTPEERAARIHRVLHPCLAKRSPSRLHEDGSFREITYAQMAEIAAASIEHDAVTRKPYSVKVLDVTPTMASVRTDAQWGVDYMHLANLDGEWRIVNVLWD